MQASPSNHEKTTISQPTFGVALPFPKKGQALPALFC
jgi:hypothetical protein